MEGEYGPEGAVRVATWGAVLELRIYGPNIYKGLVILTAGVIWSPKREPRERLTTKFCYMTSVLVLNFVKFKSHLGKSNIKIGLYLPRHHHSGNG